MNIYRFTGNLGHLTTLYQIWRVYNVELKDGYKLRIREDWNGAALPTIKYQKVVPLLFFN